MSEAGPGYKLTEVGVIPEDWEATSLAKIAANSPNAIVGGPFGSDLVSADYRATGIPVIRGQNMRGPWVSGDFVYVSPSKARELSANCARTNDIVFTQRGTLGQVAVVPDGPYGRYLISQSQMKLTVNDAAYVAAYVYHYFTSPAGQRQIVESAIQTGVPHTNLGILRGYQLPIPSTKLEQKAIAEALGKADELIAALDALIAKKRDIRQGAIRELLTGTRRLPPFEGEWISRQIGSIFDFGRTAPLSRAQLSDEGDVRYVHYGDIHTRLHTHLDFGVTAVPAAAKALCASATALRVGDWVVADASEDYDGIAKAIEITGLPLGQGAVSGLHTFLMRERVPTFAPGFKGYLSYAPQFRSQVIRAATGMKVIGISKTQMAEIRLQYPPTLEEQSAITSTLSDMDAELAALENKVAKTRDIKEGMMQVLLHGEVRLA